MGSVLGSGGEERRQGNAVSTGTLAFGNRVARADDSVVIRATDVSALPHKSADLRGPRWGRFWVLGGRRDGKGMPSLQVTIAFGNRVARADEKFVSFVNKEKMKKREIWKEKSCEN